MAMMKQGSNEWKMLDCWLKYLKFCCGPVEQDCKSGSFEEQLLTGMKNLIHGEALQTLCDASFATQDKDFFQGHVTYDYHMTF